MLELAFIIGAMIIILLFLLLSAHTIEWLTAREFGEWNISYRDFKRWYEKDPHHWRLIDRSHVSFSGGGQKVYCYFGFFSLIAYKRFYENFIYNKTPKKHRLTKAESREKIEQSYEKK